MGKLSGTSAGITGGRRSAPRPGRPPRVSRPATLPLAPAGRAPEAGQAGARPGRPEPAARAAPVGAAEPEQEVLTQVGLDTGPLHCSLGAVPHVHSPSGAPRR